MKPCRERRFTAKRTKLAVKLDEYLLRQIFSFGNIAAHPKTDRVNTTVVLPVQILEAAHPIACERTVDAGVRLNGNCVGRHTRFPSALSLPLLGDTQE